MICNVYSPAAFGMMPAQDGDESFAVFMYVGDDGRETGKGMLTYIRIGDEAFPPYVDLDLAEEFSSCDTAETAEKPVFDKIDVMETGALCLNAIYRVLILSEEQNMLLSDPECVLTTEGIFWRDDDEVVPLFRLDETLDTLPVKELDMRKFNGAVYDKFPALLDKTNIFYGHRYPDFPNAKYYEDKNKLVVFMTSEQAQLIPDSVLSGRVPMYRDVDSGMNWNIYNVYGICIVDDRDGLYHIKLIDPHSLSKRRNKVDGVNYYI